MPEKYDTKRMPDNIKGAHRYAAWQYNSKSSCHHSVRFPKSLIIIHKAQREKINLITVAHLSISKTIEYILDPIE